MLKFLKYQKSDLRMLAIIYGMADSESKILDKLPKEVKNVDDIDKEKKFIEKWKNNVTVKNL